MIHEEICTFEVAKLAKGNGFSWHTRHIYDEETKELIECKFVANHNSEDGIISTPTQSLLQRWLREEKGVVIEVIAYPTCSNNKKNCYWWSIKQNSDGICYQYEECSDTLYGCDFAFSTYELALEDALKYTRKILQ